VRQADRADRSATAARSAALRADARRAGDRARTTAQIERALLLAVAGVRLHDAPETRANLLDVLSEHAGLIAPTRMRLPGVIAPTLDGTRLVTYEDGRLALRELDGLGTLARSEPAPGLQFSNNVAFSPDGGELAALHGSFDTLPQTGPRTLADHPVVLYDAGTLTPLRPDQQLGGVPPLAAGQDVAYSANGRFITISFAVFADRKDIEPVSSPVLVWDRLAPAAPIASLDPGAPYSAVAISPDGRRVSAAIWPPGGIRTFDVATGKVVGSVDGVGGRMVSSPDDSMLAVTGLSDGVVSILDARTLATLAQLRGRRITAFYPPSFSHDGRRVAAADVDAHVVYVWDVASGQIVEELVGDSAFVDTVWFSPDDRRVFAYGEDGTVVSWDLVEGKRFLTRTPAPAGSVKYDSGTQPEMVLPGAGGHLMYVTGTFGSQEPGGSVQLRNIQDGSSADPVGPPIDLHHDGATSLSWRPDGSRFATSGADGMVRVWDGTSGAMLAERRFVEPYRFGAGLIAGVAYTPDGARLVVAEENGAVYTVDGATLEPDGRRVDIGQIVLWPVRGISDDVTIVVSNDPASGSVRLLDLASGRVIREMKPGFPPLWAAASPDRHRVVVTGEGGEVRIFDLSAGRWTGPTVAAHGNFLQWASWSQDGSLVVTGGTDGRIGLWDGHSGASLGTLTVGSRDRMLTAIFVGDTAKVRVLLPDGEIAVWSSDVREWIDFACSVAGRDLTRAEWRDTFGSRPYRRTCP
jgi:WD40 repeat protein